jgi:glucose-1-phosphate thymidylyltransferase
LVKNSTIKNSIIQESSRISNTKTQNSMIGNYVSYEGRDCDVELSLGDFCEQK